MNLEQLKNEWLAIETNEERKIFYWKFVDEFLHTRHVLNLMDLVNVRNFGYHIESQINFESNEEQSCK